MGRQDRQRSKQVIGQTISHYRIEERIGKGGMGEVFLARDTLLERKVALKFIAGKMNRDEAARQRFLREARAAAAIDHPYVCAIHEVGEAEGTAFLAMEYVDGPGLDAKLSEGPLKMVEALTIASRIADALAKAHHCGVVHRDLKPANIKLTCEGYVKVMDFGIAKRVAAVGQGLSQDEALTAITEELSPLGTLAYMPPEQLRGKQPDARCDIFSFGVLLYEMLSGAHPFRKPHPIDTAAAILNDPPPPLSRYLPQAPGLLQSSVAKMLAKDPDERYQTIGEAAADLRQSMAEPAQSPPEEKKPRRGGYLWLLAGAALILLAALGWWILGDGSSAVHPGDVAAIAVLPLDNLRQDLEQEYLVDGMTEAMLTELSRLGSLRVISRQSVMRFKGSRKPLPEIAQELGVDAVVQGSVLWSGETVRITAQLIAVMPERQLWGEQFDRPVSDVLGLHREVARSIAAAVHMALAPEEERRLLADAPVEPAAYQAYLRGRFQLDRRTPQALRESRAAFEEAILRAPGFAPAYAGLADLFTQVGMGAGGGSSKILEIAPDEAFRKAGRLAAQSLQIDPTLAEGHLAKALAGFNLDLGPGWLAAAQDGFQAALRFNPNLAEAHFWYSRILSAWERQDEAIRSALSAQALDPLSPTMNFGVASALHMARRYDEALDWYRKTLRMTPDYHDARRGLGIALAHQGKFEEALQECRRADEAVGISSERLGYIYGRAGKADLARQMMSQEPHPPDPTRMAFVELGLGNTEKALDWLEKSNTTNVWLFLKVDPVFDPLQGDPRYEALLDRFHFRP